MTVLYSAEGFDCTEVLLNKVNDEYILTINFDDAFSTAHHEYNKTLNTLQLKELKVALNSIEDL